jgi:uncharacterized protein YqcC (DUF446 family)
MSRTSSSKNRNTEVAVSIAGIEAEMKRIGYWSLERLPDEAYQFEQAFAMDTMAFSQWLQFVLIPRVHQILEEQGSFPGESMVGAQAIREFDGDEDANRLVSLLSQFDDLFSGKKP